MAQSWAGIGVPSLTSRTHVAQPCLCTQRHGQGSRFVHVRYGKGSGLEDRWALSKTIKTMQLEQLESELLNVSLAGLRRRLDKLGENTLGINNPGQLRKLLAHRLHVAKAKATRFPLRRTSKTARMGKSYILVPVDVQDVGISDFLIDTGTTGTLITSEMRDELGLSPVAGNAVRGLDNLGVTLRQKIALPELRLGPFQLDIPDGFVTNVKIAGSDNIGGVLGLRFLSSYDVELAPGPPGHMAFHPVGHVASGVICTDGCAQLSCSTTKGGLVAVQVTLNGCPPFPGIIDLGATYSTMNSAAAKAAEEAGGSLNVAKVMSGDGAMDMVVRNGVRVRLGDPTKGQCHAPPHDILPILIRDVPILSVLGFQDQPAMVLGKDLVGSGRTVLSLANNAIWLEQ